MPHVDGPWKRDARTDRDHMSLPAGKTCQDCRHFHQCVLLFNPNPMNEVCDYSPSFFVAREEDASNAPQEPV